MPYEAGLLDDVAESFFASNPKRSIRAFFMVRENRTALAGNPRSAVKPCTASHALFAAFALARPPIWASGLRRLRSTGCGGALPRHARGHIWAMVRQSGQRHGVDFVVGDSLVLAGIRLMQASVNLESGRNRAHELSALSAVMGLFGASEATIVALGEEGKEEASSGAIRLVPAWRWLL